MIPIKKILKDTCLFFIVMTSFLGAQFPETNDLVLKDLWHEHLADSEPVRRSWRQIQQDIEDTVVQVFSYIAQVDMLQPYKTPEQRISLGSGFFINDQGDIITNYHVIDQAVALFIQIPSLGKRHIQVQVVGVCPERDIALLRLTAEGLLLLRNKLGIIPYLTFGDSNSIRRADEVLALGYPLGQGSLKSTTGIISGRERNLIQMSAPINPGSSGGPLLNKEGRVVGINVAGVTKAQNVGYIIPINELKIILSDLYDVPLLRKPFSGIITIHATDLLTTFLGNPFPGGSFVSEVVKDSPGWLAGVRPDDMIYAINGYAVDIFGTMSVPYSEDKISWETYLSCLKMGEVAELEIYRKGEYLRIELTLDQLYKLPIRRVYPGYELIDYEIFGGMVCMELTLNHIKMDLAQNPGFSSYAALKNQTDSKVIITHIFPGSELSTSRTLSPGCVVNEVNGIPVHSLSDLRHAIGMGLTTNYITIEATDTQEPGKIFVVMSFDKALEETIKLAPVFRYPLSTMMQELSQLSDRNERPTLSTGSED